MGNEADTCRTLITPKLQSVGWEIEPHSIAEQRSFTDGRIVVHGNRAVRRKGKRADYLLRYTRDFPIAVVETKSEDEEAATGLQQAKEYAEILQLKFAYATNGIEIIEHDYVTGLERRIPSFPTPAELWSRLRACEKLTEDAAAQRLLTPANLTTGKEPRYYQRIAIDRAVQAIVQGKKRVLLTMATGTGKTVVAFQICWKLWSSKWNAKGDPTRKPRILYLADRNFLVDDPKDKTFSAFGDARHKIEGGVVTHSRELYFATYQSIAKDERRPGLYKEFAPDFFDLIIVDECHRGSAREDSNWRDILEYFQPAYQLGMTATPLRQDNRDTYLYFGNPIYTYSLRQGIDDGFLAPYRVHRIVTQWDAAGWRPSKEDIDRYGRRIPTRSAQRRVVIALKGELLAPTRTYRPMLKMYAAAALSIAFLGCPLLADDWPAWRGSDGSGICGETNLPLRWSTNENVRWRVALPDRGNSTPIVWKERIFITQAIGNRRTLMCLNRRTGELLWQTGPTWTGSEQTPPDNPPCTPSAVTDGQRIIAWFGSAGVYCYDLRGRESWHRDLGRQSHMWGYAATPVLDGNVCFVNFGPGERSFLISLDKRTGKTVWQYDVPRYGADMKWSDLGGKDRAGEPTVVETAGSWATPLVVPAGRQNELVVPFAGWLMAFAPKTGALLWKCGGPNIGVYSAPFFGDGIVALNASGTTNTLLAVRPGGRGDVTATHRLWMDRPGNSKTCLGAGVIHNGHIYQVNMMGFAECRELQTGRMVWEERLTGTGARNASWSAPVLAGDRLYVPNKNADVFVLRASPKFECLATNSIGGEPMNASLAVSDGEIFIRTDQRLWCIGEQRTKLRWNPTKQEEGEWTR